MCDIHLSFKVGVDNNFVLTIRHVFINPSYDIELKIWDLCKIASFSHILHNIFIVGMTMDTDRGFVQLGAKEKSNSPRSAL